MRRPNIKRVRLVSLCRTGGVRCALPLLEAPVNESELSRRSAEIYHNPNPCRAHRAAVLAVLYDELLEELALHGGELVLDRGAYAWLELAEDDRVMAVCDPAAPR